MLARAVDLGMESGSLDEDFITSGFRAIIELYYLDLLDVDQAQCVIERVVNDGFRPKQQFCTSAWCSVIALLSGPSVASQPSLFNKLVDDLMYITQYWLPKYNSDSIVYESLWAINKLLENASLTVKREFAEKSSALAAKVLQDQWLNNCKDAWEYRCPDATQALHEAGKLLSMAYVATL